MGGALSAVRRRREAEREALIALARDHVERLAERLPVVEAAVIGSVARGDFNAWSDVDVVVVVDGELPGRALDRLALVAGPARVQTWAYTIAELERERARRNAAVLERDAAHAVPLALAAGRTRRRG